MRSSLLLASALAIGTLAVPPIRPKANVVTETEFVYLTVTVYVTVDASPPPVCVSTTPLPPQVPRPVNSVKTPVALPSAPTLKPVNSVKTQAAPPPAPTPKPIDPVKTPVATPQAPALNPSPLAQVPKLPSSKPVPTPTPTPRPQPQPKPSTPQLPLIPISTPPARPSPVPSQVPSIGHPAGQNQAYLSSGQEYQDAVLYHHNAARANHGADPLVWDRECEANALLAARRCTFQHYIPPGARQGQNLFTVSGDAFNVTAGITESWYKGELAAMMPWFGQPDVPDDVFHDVGHLTQLVWKDTTKVGCVSIDCGNFMMVGGQVSSMNKYTVCNYAPAGNMGGAFARNVAAPISLTNLGGWAD